MRRINGRESGQGVVGVGKEEQPDMSDGWRRDGERDSLPPAQTGHEFVRRVVDEEVVVAALGLKVGEVQSDVSRFRGAEGQTSDYCLARNKYFIYPDFLLDEPFAIRVLGVVASTFCFANLILLLIDVDGTF